MINDKVNEVIEDVFQSLLSRYQNRLETSMKKLVILSLVVFIYRLHKRRKNPTINPINKTNNKYF